MCGAVFPVANFCVNSVFCSGEFHATFKQFEDLKNLTLNILKETLSLASWGLFTLKLYKVFKIAQCK